MKNIGIIAIVVMLVGISAMSVTAQETYTREQYMNMLPSLDKVDLSKMPVMPVGGTFDDLAHRTWYLSSAADAQMMLHSIGVSDVSTDAEHTWCVYVWNLPGDQDFVLVGWNKTTNQVDTVAWMDWETSWLYGNYPKTIADASIQDLPVITGNNQAYVILLIGGISLTALGYVAYRRSKHYK